MPELIVLKRTADLPKEDLYQASPLSPEEAQAWAARFQAEKVYYWEATQSAFIRREQDVQGIAGDVAALAGSDHGHRGT
jgi:hypothetical protein